MRNAFDILLFKLNTCNTQEILHNLKEFFSMILLIDCVRKNNSSKWKREKRNWFVFSLIIGTAYWPAVRQVSNAGVAFVAFFFFLLFSFFSFCYLCMSISMDEALSSAHQLNKESFCPIKLFPHLLACYNDKHIFTTRLFDVNVFC